MEKRYSTEGSKVKSHAVISDLCHHLDNHNATVIFHF